MSLHAVLPDEVRMGPVALTVLDRARLVDWYTAVLGLQVLAENGAASVLGTRSGEPLVVLVEDRSAERANRRSSGLYHMAILLPSRADLGRWLRHVQALGGRLDGAADHLVSEASYLSDPEGNGIEVYRDRPRGEWPIRDGHIHMDNAPFDIRGIVAQADAEGRSWEGIPDGTCMGHVHLKVADLAASRGFYVDGLGFGPTEEGYPSALFVATGGYHHHLGLNTWESAGVTRKGGTTGLRKATMLLPEGSLAPVLARLGANGAHATVEHSSVAVSDPSGNPLLLVEGTLSAARSLDL